MKIQKNSAFIDFYVDKRKYESYKTDKGRRNLINRTLGNISKSLTLFYTQGLEIREVEFNKPWEICKINDLGYCHGNKVALNKERLTFRNFGVEIISVVWSENFSKFPKIKSPEYIITSASSKLI